MADLHQDLERLNSVLKNDEDRAAAPPAGETDAAAAAKFWDDDSNAAFAHRGAAGQTTGGDYEKLKKLWTQQFTSRYTWEGKTVVDYGIGASHLGTYLFKEGNIGKYIGIDISQKSLDAAAANLKTVTDKPVVLLKTPQQFKNLKADMFVSQAVMQHFPSVQYLDEFLTNLNDACFPQAMLQFREGPTNAKDKDTYGDAQKEVLDHLRTNTDCIASKMPRYKLDWKGAKMYNDYQFSGWSCKDTPIAAAAAK